MSPAGVTTPPMAPAVLRHRRDARRLTTGQLADLRLAITKAQAVKDDRGYQAWAGIHGLPSSRPREAVLMSTTPATLVPNSSGCCSASAMMVMPPME